MNLLKIIQVKNENVCLLSRISLFKFKKTRKNMNYLLAFNF